MEAIFLPRKQYSALICNYPNGKKGVFTEQSDALRSDLPLSDFNNMMISRGLRYGLFIGKHVHDANKNDLLKELDKTGVLRCGYYFPPKDHTTSSVEYTQSEFDDLVAENNTWFKSILGYNPTTLSYGYGIYNYSAMASNYFIGGRNSGIDVNNIQYIKNYINRPSTSRWWDDTSSGAISVDQSIANVERSINTIITNGGWHNNFTHWHNVYNTVGERGIESYVKYLDMLAKYSNDLYFCSYSEACEYIWLKNNIVDIALYKPTNEYCIRLVIARRNNIPSDFCAKESIEIDLTGTILEDSTVVLDSGYIVNQSGNKYIINAEKSNIITFTSGLI